MRTTTDTVTIVLTRKCAKELESLLWEVCTETEDGVKTLRTDLELSEAWIALTLAAYESTKDQS